MTNLNIHSHPISSTISISPVLPTAGMRDPEEPGGDAPALCLGTPSSGDQGWAATYK